VRLLAHRVEVQLAHHVAETAVVLSARCLDLQPRRLALRKRLVPATSKNLIQGLAHAASGVGNSARAIVPQASRVDRNGVASDNRLTAFRMVTRQSLPVHARGARSEGRMMENGASMEWSSPAM